MHIFIQYNICQLLTQIILTQNSNALINNTANADATNKSQKYAKP